MTEPVDLLVDRDAWEAADCSVARALEVVGTRSAMLMMREAFYGTRRFDDFARRVGVTDAVAAARLRDLTAHGLLERRPYRVDGQRTRMEYRLTDMGRSLLPAIVSLMQWADTWLTDQRGGPIALTHRGCGGEVAVGLRCSHGHDVAQRDLLVGPGPAFAS